jgi:acetyl-CoA acyltransferase
MDLVDMHEAFAAQVLSNIQGFASKAWAARAGFSEATGEDRRNSTQRDGRSISIGTHSAQQAAAS